MDNVQLIESGKNSGSLPYFVYSIDENLTNEQRIIIAKNLVNILGDRKFLASISTDDDTIAVSTKDIDGFDDLYDLCVGTDMNMTVRGSISFDNKHILFTVRGNTCNITFCNGRTFEISGVLNTAVSRAIGSH